MFESQSTQSTNIRELTIHTLKGLEQTLAALYATKRGVVKKNSQGPERRIAR
jgi:hypothetical protein